MDSKVILGWETLDKGIARTKIPGGWLVTYDSGEGAGITFVPDLNHSWQGTEYEQYLKDLEVEEVEKKIIDTFQSLEAELELDQNYYERYYPKGPEQLCHASGIILEPEFKAIHGEDKSFLLLFDKALKNLLTKGEIIKVEEIDDFPKKGKIKINNGYKLKKS